MARTKEPGQVYQLKITLRDIKPPIWRRVQVKDCTLARLHDIIQTCMGWDDYHLHEFDIGGERYGDPRQWRDGFGGDVEVGNEGKVKLGQVVARGVKKFSYVYDMGDNWDHTIQIEKVLPAEAGVRYPRCIAGQRACPPEDCGGPWGYAGFGRQNLLDLDRVLPGISHVVEVGELLDAVGNQLAELDLALVADLQVAPKVVWPLAWVAVPLTTDLELVQVVVVPAHAGLDDVVQLDQRAVLHLDPPPDRGLDVPERDLQLVDLGRPLRLRHDTPPHSRRLLPCLPFQKGQNGQSSPTGKSSPSSCGQPMFPSAIATDRTPCCPKNS